MAYIKDIFAMEFDLDKKAPDECRGRELLWSEDRTHGHVDAGLSKLLQQFLVIPMRNGLEVLTVDHGVGCTHDPHDGNV